MPATPRSTVDQSDAKSIRSVRERNTGSREARGGGRGGDAHRSRRGGGGGGGGRGRGGGRRVAAPRQPAAIEVDELEVPDDTDEEIDEDAEAKQQQQQPIVDDNKPLDDCHLFWEPFTQDKLKYCFMCKYYVDKTSAHGKRMHEIINRPGVSLRNRCESLSKIYDEIKVNVVDPEFDPTKVWDLWSIRYHLNYDHMYPSDVSYASMVQEWQSIQADQRERLKTKSGEIDQSKLKYFKETTIVTLKVLRAASTGKKGAK